MNRGCGIITGVNTKIRGNLALLFTAMIWGSGFIAQRVGMATIGPFAFNGTRQVLAAVCLLPLMMREVRKSGIFSNGFDHRVRTLLAGSFVCGVFLCIGTNMQQIGLITVTAGKSGFITALYIVMVPLAGIAFGNKATFKVWGCVLLALAGFGLLSLKGGGLTTISPGDWITLGGAVGFTFQIIAVNHYVTKSNAIILSTCQMAVSGIISLLCMGLSETTTAAQLHASAIPILYAALIPTAIGYTLQIIGQKYTDPTVASLIMSMEAVFAALFGALFLKEMMTFRELTGCVMIMAATIIAQLPDRHERVRYAEENVNKQ
jgi:drug/metabolite transporter (DMT)-like permease